MNKILEYILANYTWILGGAIIILLAIIGSYADKTNFGQGKQNETKKLDQNDREQDFEIAVNEEKVPLNSELQTNIDSKNIEEKSKTKKAKNKNGETKSLNKQENLKENVEKSEEKKNINKEEKKEKSKEPDNDFEEFDEEFEEILPEKDVIDDDLLGEIDDLSLDKTQKFSFNDIPDLDDVELPKIKNLKSVDEDIWKL